MHLHLVTVTFCDINNVWCYVLSQYPIPPSSSHCSRTCPLSLSSLIQHMVYRVASTQLPLIKIIGISIFNKSLFALLFSAASYPNTFRTLFAIPLAEKMHLLFSAYHQSKNHFPAFFFVANFNSSLINMPIIHIEEI